MAGLTCTLAIKVIPNAPRTETAGWLGDALKIKIHAPALEGRANDELCKFLAASLGVPKRDVTLLQGEKARLKVIHVRGLNRADVVARLTVK